MDAAMDLIEATERLERAQTAERIAYYAVNALAPNAPLRYVVAYTDRLRRADAELTAARDAYEAAQDVECPEA